MKYDTFHVVPLVLQVVVVSVWCVLCVLCVFYVCCVHVVCAVLWGGVPIVLCVGGCEEVGA